MLGKEELIARIVDLAFAEDVGDGDVSTLCCIPAGLAGTARLIVKDTGIVAGVETARTVFRRFDPELEVTVFKGDGADVVPGDVVMEVRGGVRSLLATERVMLNIVQRMSGIATMTRRCRRAIEEAGAKAQVLDTRKTAPGMRELEKEAVRIGGGTNHRHGLYDMILLKDNHVDFCGGVARAIRKAKEYLRENGKNLKIECEVRNFRELSEALGENPDRIMFDNFTPEDTSRAVAVVAGRAETEASGGITPENIVPYALAGVDFISVGALTHSARPLDMSFKAVPERTENGL